MKHLFFTLFFENRCLPKCILIFEPENVRVLKERNKIKTISHGTKMVISEFLIVLNHNLINLIRIASAPKIIVCFLKTILLLNTTRNFESCITRSNLVKLWPLMHT